MSTKKPAKSTQAKTTAKLKDMAPRKDAKGGGKAAGARPGDKSLAGLDLGSGR